MVRSSYYLLVTTYDYLLQLVPPDGAFYAADEVVLGPGPMFHIYPLTVGLLFHLWRGTPYALEP